MRGTDDVNHSDIHHSSRLTSKYKTAFAVVTKAADDLRTCRIEACVRANDSMSSPVNPIPDLSVMLGQVTKGGTHEAECHAFDMLWIRTGTAGSGC